MLKHSNEQIRNLLRHTGLQFDQVELPWKHADNAELLFPDEISGAPRIRFLDGLRLIDWENDQWVSYEKDGIQWYKDDLSDLDYEILFDLLKPVIRNMLDSK
jgi:hypothetical protein